MIFSREYVNYLARQTVKQLIEAKMIRAGKDCCCCAERVNAAILEELSLEDRINEEVRVILDAYQEDMRRTGASYAEMFKKVKQELARRSTRRSCETLPGQIEQAGARGRRHACGDRRV